MVLGKGCEKGNEKIKNRGKIRKERENRKQRKEKSRTKQNQPVQLALGGKNTALELKSECSLTFL